MQLELRLPNSTGTISSVHLREDVSTFDVEIALQDFPVVRFSMILEGPIGGTGGACHGTAALPTGDGTLMTAGFNGRWRRTGTTVVCRHVVDVSNGWMNFDIVEWDMTGNAVTLAPHVLE